MTDGAARLRVPVRVKPGSRAPRVGGDHGGELIVAVAARAVEGAANRAVGRALAEAFGVAPAAVSLRRGARSRSKVYEVEGDLTALGERLASLLGQST